jgi:hypothetical protein
MGLQEPDLSKRAKIDCLKLSPTEWSRVGQFAVPFSVGGQPDIHADVAQQAFSSDQGSTLHLAIPVLETLHKAWSSQSERTKYEYFPPALMAAASKLEGYYKKTTDSPAYIITMCSSRFQIFFPIGL